MTNDNNSLLPYAGWKQKNELQISNPVIVPINSEQSEALLIDILFSKYKNLYFSANPREDLTEVKEGHFISPMLQKGRIVKHNEFIDCTDDVRLTFNYIYGCIYREANNRCAAFMIECYNQNLKHFNQLYQNCFQTIVSYFRQDKLFDYQDKLDGVAEDIQDIYDFLHEILDNDKLCESELVLVNNDLSKINEIISASKNSLIRFLNEIINDCSTGSHSVDACKVNEIKSYYLILKKGFYNIIELLKLKFILSDANEQYICRKQNSIRRKVNEFEEIDKEIKDVLLNKFKKNEYDKWWDPYGLPNAENCNINQLFIETIDIDANLNLFEKFKSITYEVFDNVKLIKVSE